MADDNKLFSFQGYVFLGESGASKPVNPVWVGDATLTIALETENAEHYESFSGQRMLYGQLATRKTANATLTLFEARAENFSLWLYGGVVDDAAGTGRRNPSPAASPSATWSRSTMAFRLPSSSPIPAARRWYWKRGRTTRFIRLAPIRSASSILLASPSRSRPPTPTGRSSE